MNRIVIRRTVQIVLMAGLLALLAHHPAASDGNTWPAGSWTAALHLSPAERTTMAWPSTGCTDTS
ncbi:hypothetical protein [Candidatus Amarolinea dominans]|uniref:hypothetical protein n=1 Tax=Candidatus Amarolinea dominans TaxID=3140696 RepID=UPI001D35D776|nr:hypothetical protein [Anaerolineae bacterium]